MINKDYILRIIERFSRALARIIFLREANKHEDALFFIDDLFHQTLGLSSSFINAISEDMLMALMTRMGRLNEEKCLWTALLLKAEADTYEDIAKHDESYPRYLKSLHLFFAVLLRENTIKDSDYFPETEALLTSLEQYELPAATQTQLITYYEKTGRYAQAEDLLFALAEADPANTELFQQGQAFYIQLLQKSDAELIAGNLSREEAQEGFAQLQELMCHQ